MLLTNNQSCPSRIDTSIIHYIIQLNIWTSSFRFLAWVSILSFNYYRSSSYSTSSWCSRILHPHPCRAYQTKYYQWSFTTPWEATCPFIWNISCNLDGDIKISARKRKTRNPQEQIPARSKVDFPNQTSDRHARRIGFSISWIQDRWSISGTGCSSTRLVAGSGCGERRPSFRRKSSSLDHRFWSIFADRLRKPSAQITKPQHELISVMSSHLYPMLSVHWILPNSTLYLTIELYAETCAV